MGSYQRGWAEKVEKSVTDSINGITVDSYSNDIATSILKHIKHRNTSPVRNAIWEGSNSYNDKGDIHVHLENGVIEKVELKCSKAKGSGTKANIGATALSKGIHHSITSYPTWDSESGHKAARYSLVESRIGRPIKNASDYAKTLRSIRKEDAGKEFLDQIAAITKPGQETYAVYAAEQMTHYLDATNDWVQNILSGNNTLKTIEDDANLIYCVVKNHETARQVVEFYSFAEMDSVVDSVIASGQSIKVLNKSQQVILRLSVTWKNICQGGSTPCFNVFVGNAYT